MFVEKWKRRESEMIYLWDLTNFVQNQKVRPGYKGKYEVNQLTEQIELKDHKNGFLRTIMIGIPLYTAGFLMIAGIFVGFYYLTDHARIHQWSSSAV